MGKGKDALGQRSYPDRIRVMSFIGFIWQQIKHYKNILPNKASVSALIF